MRGVKKCGACAVGIVGWRRRRDTRRGTIFFWSSLVRFPDIRHVLDNKAKGTIGCVSLVAGPNTTHPCAPVESCMRMSLQRDLTVSPCSALAHTGLRPCLATWLHCPSHFLPTRAFLVVVCGNGFVMPGGLHLLPAAHRNPFPPCFSACALHTIISYPSPHGTDAVIPEGRSVWHAAAIVWRGCGEAHFRFLPSSFSPTPFPHPCPRSPCAACVQLLPCPHQPPLLSPTLSPHQ